MQAENRAPSSSWLVASEVAWFDTPLFVLAGCCFSPASCIGSTSVTLS